MAKPPSRQELEELANRLRKNERHLRRWRSRHGISCYRLYDRDLPGFRLALDVYEDHLHAQEFEGEKELEGERLEAAARLAAEVLGLAPQSVSTRRRRRQRGLSQYEREASEGSFREVGEGGHRFLVNFTDYLDTGLFLDHRATRALVQELAPGRRFLNLFCYTASATVYAAAGGARETVSVDLSRTYLDWARRNLAMNGLRGPRHQLVQADCLKWLERAEGPFDLVFLDPPTFSNSKRMEEVFDVQRYHVQLLGQVSRLLAPEGTLIFSNNFRRFRLDRAALPELEVRDITRSTLPKDFENGPFAHWCYRIQHRSPP